MNSAKDWICEEKLGVRGFAVNNAFAEGGEGGCGGANLIINLFAEKKPSQPLNPVIVKMTV